MFHLSTELLIDYWRALRGAQSLPARADLDPAAFAAHTPQVFLAYDDGRDVRFRLAGEAVIDLHGRPLRGASVTEAWRAQHRRPLADALRAAQAGAQPVVVRAEAEMDSGPALELEILFAPLAGAGGRADRFFGHYQPLTRPAASRARELRMTGVSGVGAPMPAPPVRLAVVDGRRVG